MPHKPGGFANLRLVLALRALEQADEVGEFLPAAERRAWSRAAGLDVLPEGASAGRVLETLGERARLANGARLPWTVRPLLLGLSGCDLHRGWLALLVVAAAAGGAYSLWLGERGALDLLAWPLVLLVAWNVAVYLYLFVRGIVSLVGPARPGWVASALSRWSGARVALRRLRRERGETSATWREILDFAERAIAAWRAPFLALAGPVLRRRFASILHLAALAWALGAIGGLLHLGASTDHAVHWRSTFLDQPAVAELLAALFLPASRLFDLPLPLEQLGALQRASGDPAPAPSAKPWYDLHVATLVLFVVGPRALLFLALRIGAVVAMQRAACSPLVRGWFGEVRRVVIGPPAKPAWRVCVRNDDRSLPEPILRALATWGADHEAFSTVEPVALHSRMSAEDRASHLRGADALFVGMDVAPDDEARADLAVLREVAEREDEVRVVFLDAGWFFERFGDSPGLERTWRERQAAWREAVGIHPVRPVFLRVRPGALDGVAQSGR